MIKKHKTFISIYVVLMIIGMIVLYKTELYPKIHRMVLPLLLMAASVPLITRSKMKDKMMQLYMILTGLFTAAAMFSLGLKDHWISWFGTFIGFSIMCFVPLLLASLRRNYQSHGLSLLRKHPWVSALIMAGGYFIYRDISAQIGSRQLPVILLLASAIIAIMFVFERHDKVRNESYYPMVYGSIALFMGYGLALHSIFTHGAHPNLIYLITIFVGMAGLLLILATIEFDEK